MLVQSYDDQQTHQKNRQTPNTQATLPIDFFVLVRLAIIVKGTCKSLTIKNYLLMITSITNLPKGTHFRYDGSEWIVTDDSYPFVEAHRIHPKDEYDTIFTNFELVEVDEDTETFEYYFAKTKHGFQLKRK